MLGLLGSGVSGEGRTDVRGVFSRVYAWGGCGERCPGGLSPSCVHGCDCKCVSPSKGRRCMIPAVCKER